MIFQIPQKQFKEMFEDCEGIFPYYKVMKFLKV